MARLDGEEIETAFRALGYLRAIEKLGPDLAAADTWRRLVPHLTVSDAPPADGAAAIDHDWAQRPQCGAQLRTEGYFLTPPVVPAAEIDALKRGITRLVDRGLPPGFVQMYDEFYRVYASLMAALVPILGPDPAFVPEDFWAFFVPPGDPALSQWTAFPPHRDWVYDESVMTGGLPATLVAWVALTDVTTADSCMYVVPGDRDDGYRSGDRHVDPAKFRLQDIRAVPARAGQVLLFTSHIAHWGSRSSRWATSPRMSLSAFLQRRDAPNRQTELRLQSAVPVHERLRWVLHTVRLMIGREAAQRLADRAGLTLPPQPTQKYSTPRP